MLQATPHIVGAHTGTQTSGSEVNRHSFEVQERFRTFVVRKNNATFEDVGNECHVSFVGRESFTLIGDTRCFSDTSQDGGRQIQQSSKRHEACLHSCTIELHAAINLPVAGAQQVRIHEDSCVMHAIVTTNGQLSVDLIVKVEGEDEFSNIHQTCHWSTKSTYKTPVKTHQFFGKVQFVIDTPPMFTLSGSRDDTGLEPTTLEEPTDTKTQAVRWSQNGDMGRCGVSDRGVHVHAHTASPSPSLSPRPCLMVPCTHPPKHV